MVAVGEKATLLVLVVAGVVVDVRMKVDVIGFT